MDVTELIKAVWAYTSGNTLGLINTIISVGIIASAVGAFVKILRKVDQVAKEVRDFLGVVILALSDNKLTNDEIVNIIKEAKDVPRSIKDLINAP